MRLNYKVVFFIMGVLLIIEGAFMLLSIPFSLIYKDSDALYLFVASFLTLLTGFLIWASFRSCSKSVGKHEGYIIVAIGWIVFSAFGALPFILSPQGITNYTDAFFETMSGFTTTGASILNDIEALSHGLLFWRSLIQWLGGMGIIVLSLVILPTLGIGGMQLFVAEVPGPTPDKIHPRVKETAKRLWGVYAIFTLAEIILLWIGGMGLFDSICHSFTTMATGGYSTKQASIAAYPSAFIQYVITIFMFIAGVNFTLNYFFLHFRFKPIWKNEEFRWYTSFVLFFTIVIAIIVYVNHDISAEKAFRDSFFQVTSIITTTGFATYDYLEWVSPAWVLLFLLMFFGGSAGSTGGSVKIIRIILVIKNGLLELKRIVHPNAIIPVRIDKQGVQPEVLSNVLAFISVYLVIMIVGTTVMSFMGHDLDTSMGAVAATLGNIGPGIGDVGPAYNFAGFSISGKWFLSFLMLVGRLELFTVLVLFAPAFWKK